MLSKSWQESLKANLKLLNKPDRPARMAVLGIGHELGGDDAAGVQVAAALNRGGMGLEDGRNRMLAVEAGPAPENFTGLLRRFEPDLVLLVDAALMGCQPGAVKWLNWQGAEGFSASTHTLPLHILASYLIQEMGCEVALVGIQPLQTYADAPLTPEVGEAVQQVALDLAHCMTSQRKIILGEDDPQKRLHAVGELKSSSNL